MNRSVVTALEAAVDEVNARHGAPWCRKTFVVLRSPPSPSTLASTIPMPRIYA